MTPPLSRAHCEKVEQGCVRWERVRLATPQDVGDLCGHECSCACTGCLAALRRDGEEHE